MGFLQDGQWVTRSSFPVDQKGNFIRKGSQFHHFIKADGSTNFKPEVHRYHIYISYACPWACRTLIFRKLKQLESIISFSYVDAFMGESGWTFGVSSNKTIDPLYHKKFLYEIYTMAQANYSGRVTVPVLWDKHQQTIVNNESAEIIRMLNSEFNAFTENTLDFYPKALQSDIDKINQFIYDHVNNGVYKCGFATTQDAYHQAFIELFHALNYLEKLLSQQRYLVGDQITEADWRLFTTLIRFDVVYYGHFKCNKKHIKDYPNLYNYMLELYQYPGIKETVDFEQIKQHYYQSHESINPIGIVPEGPDFDYDQAFKREL